MEPHLAMEPAAVTAFAVVFGVFVVAVVTLVVLVLRFTLQRAAARRAEWLASSEDGDGAGDETNATDDGTGDEADPDGGDGPDGDDEEPPVTALVLAGGGTRGAIQIGMLQVLAEVGFVPDLVFGASVGAINGVGFAGDPSPDGVARMTAVWLGLTREDVYPQGRLHGPWLYLQQRDAVYVNSGLRRIVEAGLSAANLEDAAIPVEVVATSLTDGGEHWFTRGPAVDAVLASTAMPAIFPPVEVDGERFIDGGIVNNVPIQRAIDAGATRIVVLLCSPPTFTPTVPKRPVEAMVTALLMAIHSRFPRDMANLPEGVEVILCVGDEHATRDFDDFSTTAELIAYGRREALDVVLRHGLGTLPASGTLPEAGAPGSAAPPPVAVAEPPGGADDEASVRGDGAEAAGGDTRSGKGAKPGKTAGKSSKGAKAAKVAKPLKVVTTAAATKMHRNAASGEERPAAGPDDPSGPDGAPGDGESDDEDPIPPDGGPATRDDPTGEPTPGSPYDPGPVLPTYSAATPVPSWSPPRRPVPVPSVPPSAPDETAAPAAT